MKTFVLIWSIISLLALSKCSPVYVPNTRNIPDLEHAGEVKVTGMVSTNGLELNSNLMMAKNLGFMANLSFADQKGTETRIHKHFFAEGGIGYHIISGRINAAVYAGHGYGSAYAEDVNIFSDTLFAEGDFHRTFVQSSIAINAGIFVPSFALRFSRVHFINYNNESSKIERSEISFFAEPALQLGFRSDPWEAAFQFGFIKPLGGRAINIEYRVFHLSMGLSYRINQ